MMGERETALAYRTQLAGSLSVLVNLWWSPSFRAGMVEASGEDVGRTEARLLWELGHLKTARPHELAARMELGAPSITKTISKLRARGLLTQVVSDDDRRGRVIALTDAGRQVTQRLYDVGDCLVANIVGGWEPSRIKDFTEMMHDFVARAVTAGASGAENIDRASTS